MSIQNVTQLNNQIRQLRQDASLIAQEESGVDFSNPEASLLSAKRRQLESEIADIKGQLEQLKQCRVEINEVKRQLALIKQTQDLLTTDSSRTGDKMDLIG